MGGDADPPPPGQVGAPPRPAFDPYARPPSSGLRRWIEGRGARVPSNRVLGIILLVTLILVVVASRHSSSSDTGGPPLAADCTHPGLALSPQIVPQGNVVRYTVAGPTDAEYVLVLDAATLRRDPNGELVATAATAGRPAQVVPSPGKLSNCRATGSFNAKIDEGAHLLGLFELRGNTATRLLTRPLQVGPPQ